MSPFPHPSEASADGLLAVGGELSADWLLTAYSEGIFPWFEDDDGPVMWWSPDPRGVLRPGKMRVTKSLARTLAKQRFQVTIDQTFKAVIAQCANLRAQSGTWITPAMIEAYSELHDLGFAHSVEVWAADELVGGLYGLSLGRMFFGESMFATATDASKVAFAALNAQLQIWQFDLIDAQMPNAHLGTLGVEAMARQEFLGLLEENPVHDTRRGLWTLETAWLETAIAMRNTR